MRVIEVEGKTVDDAIKKAAQKIGVEMGEIDRNDIEILDEGKSGIFGIGVSRVAKIRVTCRSMNTEDVGDKTREILEALFTKMGIDAVIRELHESESKVYIELECADSGLVIGKQGKTLESIQFLVNLMVNTQTKSDKKIILDIEAYRAKRERTLKKLSRDVALKVIRTGKPQALEPMNPFERRLVHMTLQTDTRVMTKSEGQGVYRKVKVYPRDYVEKQ